MGGADGLDVFIYLAKVDIKLGLRNVCVRVCVCCGSMAFFGRQD